MPSIRSRILYRLIRTRRSPFDARRSISEQRQALERQSRLVPVPRRVRIQPVTDGPRPADWLRPEGACGDRAVIYLHGGGYALGSRRTPRAMAARLAVASKSPVLILDYRLAPEHPFPAALEDTIGATRWLRTQGISREKLALAGDSAGGGLALSTAIAMRDRGEPLPACLACFSPWTDLALTGESLSACAKSDPLIGHRALAIYAAAYAGEEDPYLPLISPIYADLHDLPPILIQVGEHEVLKSDSLRLAERARDAGVDVTLELGKGMWHVWQVMARLMPEAQQAIDRAGAFLDRHLTG